MGAAYSLDLRERIVAAVHGGLTIAATAATFAVEPRTVKRYLAQERRTGQLAPRRIPGRPRAIRDDAALLAQVQATPDATLAEHCAAWAAAHGTRVSEATMCRALRRLHWTRKKRR
jgi:transposase